MTSSKIKVRESHEFHELTRIYKRTIKIIRVNTCNSWRKIASKFKTVNLSKLFKSKQLFFDITQFW